MVETRVAGFIFILIAENGTQNSMCGPHVMSGVTAGTGGIYLGKLYCIQFVNDYAMKVLGVDGRGCYGFLVSPIMPHTQSSCNKLLSAEIRGSCHLTIIF